MRRWGDGPVAVDRATILLGLVLWLATGLWAYAEGRDTESRLTLDAFAVAHEANYRLGYAIEAASRTFHVSEKAMWVCLVEDMELHEQLTAYPQEWPVRTFTVEGR